MKKIYLTALSLGLVLGATAQNSMLTNQTTGQLFTTGLLTDIEMATNGTDVVLIAANDGADEFYAIDIDDNDPADAVANTVITIPNFQALMDGIVGSSFTMITFEVNPISKAVYVLGSSTGNSYIVKIEDNGSTVSLMDLNNITYSKINWPSTQYAGQDMTFGDNTLYVTSGSWSLDGEISWIAAPFDHNATMTARSTTMYKTNWGGAYYTDAPLERMDYAYINGEHRLLGVTVCAPGFSIETSTLAGGGLLQVTEDFNVNWSPPNKCVHQTNGGKHWLFDLHSASNVLVRIGEEYLDGSVIGNNEYNNNAQLLRDNGGNPAPGLNDDQVKIYTEVYDEIAFWDHHNLLVLENDELKLFETGVTTTQIEESTEVMVSIYPNPANEIITIQTDNVLANGQIIVKSIDGKEMLRRKQLNTSTSIDVSDLAAGAYIVTVISADTEIYSDKLIIE